MDFVVELLELLEFNVVINMVDFMFKRVYFILNHTTVTIEGIAKLFLYHIWKLHSLLFCVVSDIGLQFVALFIKKFYCLLGVEIAFSMV